METNKRKQAEQEIGKLLLKMANTLLIVKDDRQALEWLICDVLDFKVTMERILDYGNNE